MSNLGVFNGLYVKSVTRVGFVSDYPGSSWITLTPEFRLGSVSLVFGRVMSGCFSFRVQVGSGLSHIQVGFNFEFGSCRVAFKPVL